MQTIQTIMERRSTRGFSAQALTQTELQTLADVALASPSARNTQRWHFSFVSNTELLDDFANTMSAWMQEKTPVGQRGRFDDNDFHVFYHAPTVIFISAPSGDAAGRFDMIDCGIAVENLALAAWDMGLGNVIVGLPTGLLNAPEGERFRKAFDFPEGYEFTIGICIGHNTVTKEAHPIGENKISYIK